MQKQCADKHTRLCGSSEAGAILLPSASLAARSGLDVESDMLPVPEHNTTVLTFLYSTQGVRGYRSVSTKTTNEPCVFTQNCPQIVGKLYTSTCISLLYTLHDLSAVTD